MNVYVDGDGRWRDLDAEQATFARAWWFRLRVCSGDDGSTFIASAYRKIWPLHSMTADDDAESGARAKLLDLLAQGFDQI